MAIIGNRYELMFFTACTYSNMNGDPDNDNMPRRDTKTHTGEMTSGCVKRKIRNAVSELFGENIYLQDSVNTTRLNAEVKEEAEIEVSSKKKKDIASAEKAACAKFYDVRTFGAVMTSNAASAGRICGPVQVNISTTVDPIEITNLSITRNCVTSSVPEAKSAADLLRWEENQPIDKLRTMGRKYVTPFGLYCTKVSICPKPAAKTGFSEEDLQKLLTAIRYMYNFDASDARSDIHLVGPVIAFKHVGRGDENNPNNVNSAQLGCADWYKLFELVDVHRREGVEAPRSYRDYEATIDISHMAEDFPGVLVGGITEDGKFDEEELLHDNWMHVII